MPELLGMPAIQRTFSAYPGTGSVYGVIARDSGTNRVAAYVPAATYACSIVYWDDTCEVLSEYISLNRAIVASINFSWSQIAFLCAWHWYQYYHTLAIIYRVRHWNFHLVVYAHTKHYIQCMFHYFIMRPLNRLPILTLSNRFFFQNLSFNKKNFICIDF